MVSVVRRVIAFIFRCVDSLGACAENLYFFLRVELLE